MAVGPAGAVEPVGVPAAAGRMKGAGTDLKVADDVKSGSMRLSGIGYGTSDRLGRARLVLHYEDAFPCEDGETHCGMDRPVQVPGFAHDAAARKVVFNESGSEPVVCANVRHRGFPWFRDAFDATGNCAYHLVKVDRLVDDGFGGRRDRREEVHFDVRRP
jgi:hypothetical protein